MTLLVLKAVLLPLSSIFKKIFSGIISITSFRVGIDNPPFNSTYLKMGHGKQLILQFLI